MAATKKIGRPALRAEGAQWNAYYAMKDTMDGAVLLGSICLSAVTDNEARKRAFMDLMRDVVTDFIKEAVGVRPTWGNPETAPEHERSGNA